MNPDADLVLPPPPWSAFFSRSGIETIEER